MRSRSLVTLAALSLLLTACPQAEEEPEPTPSPEQEVETDEEDPQLVVGLSSDPGHLNPAVTTSGAVHFASELMYNGLLALDEDLEPLPELAESWEIEDDGATYVFTLRDDVVWHDGEPFTSADVRFTFEEALLELHSRTRASLSGALEGIETPDEHTVVFRFSEPYAPLLLQLDVTEAPILPEHVFAGAEDLVEHPASQEPVGTGPFRFVSYTPDSEVRLERNDDYFKEGLPRLEEVVFRIIPEDASQVIALETGEVDFLWRVPRPDIQRLEDSGDVEFIGTNLGPGGANCVMTMTYNLERPLFADVRLRQAIAHALDREQFLERVEFGRGHVARAPIHRGIPWAHAEDVALPEFDRERAAALLDEAGWVRQDGGVRTAQGVEGVQDGTELTFDFVHFPTFSQYGELLRAQLAEIGAEVNLRPLEPPVFVETVFTERDFDTNIISYCNGTDPEIGVRRMYDSEQIGAVPFSNAAAYRNERVDALFDEARGVIDQDERSRLYGEIQDIVVEDLPYFWIIESEFTVAHRAECRDLRGHGLFAEEAVCRR